MVKRDLVRQVTFFVLLLLGFIGLRLWFFEPVIIRPDMENRYLEEGDLIIAVRNSRLHHGDFVLYEQKSNTYVSRVIALEGEDVIYMDDILYRNGAIEPEGYLKTSASQESYTEDLTIATVTNGQFESIPKGYYFVLNDDRTNQQDSRKFGLVSRRDIIGRLTFRVTPLSDFGFIKTGLVQ